MGFSTDRVNKILDHVVGKTALTFTSGAFYLGLSSTAPLNDATQITEQTIGVNGYARVQVIASDFEAAASRMIRNAVEKTFPTATGDWVGSGTPLTHGIAFNSSTLSTAAAFISFGALGTPKPVANTDIPKVLINQLVLTITV